MLRKAQKGFRPRLALSFSAALFLALFAVSSLRAQGWDKQKRRAPSVVVDIGNPQVWTLEEAHYLLERNRAYDLGLREQDPGSLNPNQTAGVRVQALSTLLSASVQFDQSIGAKNSSALSLFNTQLAQYNAEFNERSALMAQQIAIQSSLGKAQAQVTALQNATPVDTNSVTAASATVNQLTNENSALASQITALNTSLATAPTVPSLASAIPNDETSQTALGDNPTFDNLVKTFNTGPQASQLSASQQLDNYVDFQYEMVAKQLTLLRDEVGPNRRIIFLELPHSIYITDKVHLYPYFGGIWGNYVVQSWWKIGGALQVHPLNRYAIEDGAHRAPTLQEISALGQNFDSFAKSTTKRLQNQINSLHNQIGTLQKQIDMIPNCRSRQNLGARLSAPAPCADLITTKAGLLETTKNLTNRQRQISAAQATSKAAIEEFLPDRALALGAATDLDASAPMFAYSDDPTSDWKLSFESWAANWLYGVIQERGTPGFFSAPIYALDLIPRENSLNVTEAYTSTHMTGFAGLFGWLSGIGGRARYERQQQQFNQFTQIEDYASGFGKGDYAFGWTFGPNPGTKRIAAGLRTTYAVLVIPKDVRVIRLYAMGCGYRRRDVPRNPFSELAVSAVADPPHQHMLDAEDCGAMKTFDLDIPDGDDDFWISNANYQQVPAGQRVTLAISGRFGDQTGILVNGTPLQLVPSISQPALTTPGYTVPANAGDSSTQGVFEIVHTRRDPQVFSGTSLVASFTMAPTFTGTPVITIVSAAREKAVNDVPCPGNRKVHLLDIGCGHPPMFYAPPSITRVDAEYPALLDSAKSNEVVLKVVGRGFVEAPDSTVVIGPTTLQPRRNKQSEPAKDTEFKVLPGGTMIEATLTRSRYFPQWSIDYISKVQGQVIDTNATRDDSAGPALISACTYTAGEASGGSTPISLTLAGNFFASSILPSVTADGSSDAKAVSGLSASLKNVHEWDVAVSIPSATRTVSVSIAPAIASYKQTFVCTRPPLAKKTSVRKPPPRKGKGVPVRKAN